MDMAGRLLRGRKHRGRKLDRLQTFRTFLLVQFQWKERIRFRESIRRRLIRRLRSTL
jgi:hypothetical protein